MMTEEWTRSILDAAYAPMIGALPPGAATIVQSFVHDYGNTLTAYNRLEVASRAVVDAWDRWMTTSSPDRPSIRDLDAAIDALRPSSVPWYGERAD